MCRMSRWRKIAATSAGQARPRQEPPIFIGVPGVRLQLEHAVLKQLPLDSKNPIVAARARPVQMLDQFPLRPASFEQLGHFRAPGTTRSRFDTSRRRGRSPREFRANEPYGGEGCDWRALTAALLRTGFRRRSKTAGAPDRDPPMLQQREHQQRTLFLRSPTAATLPAFAPARPPESKAGSTDDPAPPPDFPKNSGRLKRSRRKACARDAEPHSGSSTKGAVVSKCGALNIVFAKGKTGFPDLMKRTDTVGPPALPRAMPPQGADAGAARLRAIHIAMAAARGQEHRRNQLDGQRSAETAPPLCAALHSAACRLIPHDRKGSRQDHRRPYVFDKQGARHQLDQRHDRSKQCRHEKCAARRAAIGARPGQSSRPSRRAERSS